MRLEQIQYFVTLVQTLNFSRTAEIHFVSQTAITQQIKLMEEELGLKLFERTKRRVELTNAGKAYYEQALKILDLVEIAAKQARIARESSEEHLVISIMPAIEQNKMIEYLLNFRKNYPEVILDFQQGRFREIWDSIEKKETDLAFSLEIYPLNHPDISKYHIKNIQHYVVMNSNSRFTQYTSIRREQLKGETIFTQRLPKEEWNVISSQFIQNNFDLDHIVFVDSLRTLIYKIAFGQGYAILAESALEGIPLNLPLAVVPLENDIVPFYIYWNKSNQNPALQKFISTLSS
jgi:DNA-binding transcriptional LysR family regulator